MADACGGGEWRGTRRDNTEPTAVPAPPFIGRRLPWGSPSNSRFKSPFCGLKAEDPPWRVFCCGPWTGWGAKWEESGALLLKPSSRGLS
jgi:hypothetical protein